MRPLGATQMGADCLGEPHRQKQTMAGWWGWEVGEPVLPFRGAGAEQITPFEVCPTTTNDDLTSLFRREKIRVTVKQTILCLRS